MQAHPWRNNLESFERPEDDRWDGTLESWNGLRHRPFFQLHVEGAQGELHTPTKRRTPRKHLTIVASLASVDSPLNTNHCFGFSVAR